MPKTIPLAFTDADVRRIAGDLSYRRGVDLFSQGHVEALKDWGDSMGALVGGDPAYEVTLESSRRDPYHACDCAGTAAGRSAIAVAKITACEAAGKVAAITHAVHGAIGFTAEHSLHHATQRLWSWRSEFGNLRWWSETLGRALCEQGAGRAWPMLADGTLQFATTSQENT